MSIINIIKDFFEGLNSQISSVEKNVNRVSYNVEKQIKKHTRKIKREITSLFLFLMFITFTVVFLLLGIIVILNKFLDLEIILLIFGGFFAVLSILVKL